MPNTPAGHNLHYRMIKNQQDTKRMILEYQFIISYDGIMYTQYNQCMHHKLKKLFKQNLVIAQINLLLL